VMVVFGGRSGEHDVPLASARAITEALQKSGRHEVVPVGITRGGRWISSGEPMRELESEAGYLPDGSDLDEHIEFVAVALRERSDELGLAPRGA